MPLTRHGKCVLLLSHPSTEPSPVVLPSLGSLLPLQVRSFFAAPSFLVSSIHSVSKPGKLTLTFSVILLMSCWAPATASCL
jgi:hypothetical protein